MKRLLILITAAVCLIFLILSASAGRVLANAPSVRGGGETAVRVPVLLFHHLADESTNSMTVTSTYFETVLQALDEAGFHTVTPEQMMAYVEGRGNLPARPVLLTFDDGYESNVLLAAPLLSQYNMCATVFVIGVSVGKDTYKETGVPMTPHFSWAQAQEASDVLTVQSHTYDMHQVSQLDQQQFREGVLQRDGEDDAAYQEAFEADCLRSKDEIERNLGKPVIAYAYPYGQHSKKTESMLKEMGICMTFLTAEGENLLIPGDATSLFSLNRKTIYPDTSIDEMLEYVTACPRA